MHPGWIGAIAGITIGGIGGAIGTYCSIKNTNGPRERRFVIQMSALLWVVIIVLLALMLALPSPWRHFMWIPFGIIFPLMIPYLNRKQQQIRREESGQDEANL